MDMSTVRTRVKHVDRIVKAILDAAIDEQSDTIYIEDVQLIQSIVEKLKEDLFIS